MNISSTSTQCIPLNPLIYTLMRSVQNYGKPAFQWYMHWEFSKGIIHLSFSSADQKTSIFCLNPACKIFIWTVLVRSEQSTGITLIILWEGHCLALLTIVSSYVSIMNYYYYIKQVEWTNIRRSPHHCTPTIDHILIH